jgi:DNA-binding NtrC family response regulator
MIHRNILVVDDASDWRDLFQSSLQRSKYRVDTAANLKEALERLIQNNIELVIVDLRLDLIDEDNRDGMALLKELNRRSINALVVTGYGTAALQREAKALECITFISKTSIGHNGNKLKKIVNEIFAEIESRDRIRTKLTEDFVRGKPIGYPAEAAGYPLRESLSKKVEAVLED